MVDFIQVGIPGLDEYNQRIDVLKQNIASAMVAIGGILSEAKSKFANHPRQYWEDWLRSRDIKIKDADRAIAAFSICGDLPIALPERTIKAIVSAPPEAQQTVRQIILSGQEISYKNIKKIIQESKSIGPGKLVQLSDESMRPGAIGTVIDVNGEILRVQVGDDIIPCFLDEVSLTESKTVTQVEQIEIQTTPVQSQNSNEEILYRLRRYADECAKLQGSLYRIWLSPTGNIKEQIEFEYPHVVEWGSSDE